MSGYAYRERENNDRFDVLAGKLTQLRNITNEIHQEAHDSGMIDKLSNTMSGLFEGVQNTSTKLKRSMGGNVSLWKIVGIILIVIIVLYTLYKLF